MQKVVYFCTPKEFGKQSNKRVLIDWEIYVLEKMAEKLLHDEKMLEAERIQRTNRLKNAVKK